MISFFLNLFLYLLKKLIIIIYFSLETNDEGTVLVCDRFRSAAEYKLHKTMIIRERKTMLDKLCAEESGASNKNKVAFLGFPTKNRYDPVIKQIVSCPLGREIGRHPLDCPTGSVNRIPMGKFFFYIFNLKFL